MTSTGRSISAGASTRRGHPRAIGRDRYPRPRPGAGYRNSPNTLEVRTVKRRTVLLTSATGYIASHTHLAGFAGRGLGRGRPGRQQLARWSAGSSGACRTPCRCSACGDVRDRAALPAFPAPRAWGQMLVCARKSVRHRIRWRAAGLLPRQQPGRLFQLCEVMQAAGCRRTWCSAPARRSTACPSVTHRRGRRAVGHQPSADHG